MAFLEEMQKYFNRGECMSTLPASPSKRLSQTGAHGGDTGSPKPSSFMIDRGGHALGKMFKQEVKREEFFRIAELFIKSTFR